VLASSHNLSFRVRIAIRIKGDVDCHKLGSLEVLACMKVAGHVSGKAGYVDMNDVGLL
jgi:hypothetical protein